MTVTITLFLISMFGLAGLLASKAFEIKVRKIDFLVNLFLKGDKMIRAFGDLLVFKYNRYKKISNIFIFDFLPSYLYELLVKMKDYVAKKYYNAGDNIRGRRILKSNGSVSSFLEQLAEDRVEKKL
ncbi:MAG: hypothetical protein QG579_134 [Patescibacteria group bacterium]|jgi:hypothetical protein|nr:hypothetical protein [Patescibacteria group bacterium]